MSQLFFLGEGKWGRLYEVPSTMYKDPSGGESRFQSDYPLQHSALGVHHSTLGRNKSREARNETLIVAIRDSYVSRISTSSFFNQRSVFDISKNIVLRSSYFEFLPDTSYFVQICHFNILHSALDIRHLFTYRIS